MDPDPHEMDADPKPLPTSAKYQCSDQVPNYFYQGSVLEISNIRSGSPPLFRLKVKISSDNLFECQQLNHHQTQNNWNIYKI